MTSKVLDFSEVWDRDPESSMKTESPRKKNWKRNLFLQAEENKLNGKVIFKNDIFIAGISEKTNCMTFIPRFKKRYIRRLSKRRYDIIWKSYFPIMIPKDVENQEEWLQNYLKTENKKQKKFINEIWKHKSEIFEGVV